MQLELNLFSNRALNVCCRPGAVLGLETHGEQNHTEHLARLLSRGPGTDGVTAHTQLQPGCLERKVARAQDSGTEQGSSEEVMCEL